MNGITLPAEIPAEAPISPVPEASRNRLIDALRGVALLGILLMNIPGFAMPDYSSESFRNDPTNVNFWVRAVINTVFEGKMRALFGMIFGAGVVLFVTRKEQSGKSVTGLFYRRMFWLILFGLIHAHVILWLGDILFLYGVCGMIVYLFRNVNPKYLILAVPIVAVLDFSANTVIYRYVRSQRIEYVEAKKVEQAGGTLTDNQKQAIENWHGWETSFIPNREEAAKNTQTMKSGYATVASRVRKLAIDAEFKFLLMEIWDSLALMLLGIALFKWGFLTGEWSTRAYVRTMLLGYGIGMPLVVYSFYHGYLYNPNLEAMLLRMEQVPVEWVGLIYPFQRILLVMAHVSGLVLLYQAGIARRLFSCLEAVGQMAFTNYITHSVICTLVFFGYGLNYYAEMEFYQIYFVALGIWAMQLVVSPIWLHYFRFGPLEWLWRTLTYWKWQPFLKKKAASPD
ncbi:MAG: DUF418 domain-containing protein [Gemmataceae bacterium]